MVRPIFAKVPTPLIIINDNILLLSKALFQAFWRTAIHCWSENLLGWGSNHWPLNYKASVFTIPPRSDFVLSCLTLDCRVGPLDFFEGSSSPGPILTGQGPCWGLPQQFGTIFWRFLMKLGIVGLSILTFWCQRSLDPWTKVRWEYNLTQNMKVYFFCMGHLPELEFLIYLQNPGL